LIKDCFLTTTSNSAGLIGIRFFIRGKPWVVTIDDTFLYQFPSSPKLKFAQEDKSNTAMWGPLLEKAWAKVKGSYDNADGGFVQTGLRALTGLPVFSYKISDIADITAANAAWTSIKSWETAGYYAGAGTSGGADTTTNSCGIANGHAYSILSAFELTTGGVTYKLLLMRNPWGTTSYSSDWSKTDAKWTAANIA
jgi:hypothetical protein